MHERVKNQIENQTKVYSTKGNRGRKELVLNEGECGDVDKMMIIYYDHAL